MSVSTALFSSLTGLRVNETRLDVIGNNIANANTTAFKASRVTFQTAFAETLTIGSAGTGNVAASNPSQIGLGAGIGATTLDFTTGGLSRTGRSTDLAVEGNGFFVVKDVDGTTYYTRDGAFTMNANLDLTTSSGYVLQGFGIDRNGQVVPGILTNVNVPIGQMTIARPTSRAVFAGNMSASGQIGTQGSILTSEALVDTVAGTTSGTSLLVNLAAAGAPATHLFAAGDTLTLTPNKGGRPLPSSVLNVTGATTLADLNAWFEGALGIQTGASMVGAPGVRVNAAGQIEITGNVGADNHIGVSDLFLVSSNPALTQPLNFNLVQEAAGESCRTSFGIFDSLGQESIVDVTAVLQSVGTNGDIVWRFFAESEGNETGSLALGSGTITFNERGVFSSAAGTTLSLDRSGTGAATPVIFNLDFSNMTSLASGTSEIALTTQDGAPLGTLSTFSVDRGGMVMGQFSNGLSVPVAQIALATFSNPEGLLQQGENLFLVGPNSGLPVVSAPGSLGAGSVIGGALEQSNVDMAREFIELIVTSSGFAANSRVISTANRLLTELLNVTS
jgi:flagellar hook protein FlgE